MPSMTCPDDGGELRDESPGIHACRRCRAQAMHREVFAG
jgi:hypothetical protein